MATPVPSPTQSPIGQDCSLDPGGTFSALWLEHRSLLGCPVSGQATVSTIAEEAFQGGHMFWRSDTNAVYVIYDRDKSGDELHTGTWESDPTWNWAAVGEPDPEGIGLLPPAGLVEPKRGVGWLWRTYLGRENGRLGWALDKEYGFDNVGQSQAFERGLIFKGSSSRIYVLLYDGRFFSSRGS
jgi:hypothetical protein